MTEQTGKDPVLIDIPMPIETPRLIIRPPQAGDGAALHEAKRETWDMLAAWMPWAKDIGTADDDEATMRKAHARFILREDLMLAAFEKASGRFVIGTGLHRFDWQTRRFEIGYWARKSAQGKGYVTESTNALIRYAFGALAANAVAIDVADGNTASIAVAQRLGLKKEGVLQNDLTLPDGRVVDRHVYGTTSISVLPPLQVKWGPP